MALTPMSDLAGVCMPSPAGAKVLKVGYLGMLDDYGRRWKIAEALIDGAAAVIAHSCLYQQARHVGLQLRHLPYNRVWVAQRSPPLSNLDRVM